MMTNQFLLLEDLFGSPIALGWFINRCARLFRLQIDSKSMGIYLLTLERYKLSPTTSSKLFKIDEKTGELFLTMPIDREETEKININIIGEFFDLKIVQKVSFPRFWHYKPLLLKPLF